MAHAALLDALQMMLEPDGLTVRVHADPLGNDADKLEIMASPGGCSDCIVPKPMLVAVINQQLPPEMSIEEADLIYPGETWPPTEIASES